MAWNFKSGMGLFKRYFMGDSMSPHREEEIRLLNRQLMVQHSSGANQWGSLSWPAQPWKRNAKLARGWKKDIGEKRRRRSLSSRQWFSNRKGKGREGVGGLFSSLLLASSILALQHRFPKWISNQCIWPTTHPCFQDHQLSLLNSYSVPPLKPLRKSLHHHPDLWVIRKWRTPSSLQEKLDSTCPRKSICKFRYFAVFPVQHFWSPAR